MSESLLQRARITDHNLRLRREFIRLDDGDRKVLASLREWGTREAPGIAKQFYDHQFAFAPTARFFQAFAAERGMGLDGLRRHLETAQAGYLVQIFDEAATADFGASYFERRMNVGSLHNVIDLPVKWYMGSYSMYFDLFRERLAKSFWWRPGLRRKAEGALLKVFNYDSQAVMDSFFLELLNSLGFDTANIPLEHEDHDVTENLREFKRTVREALMALGSSSDDLTVAGREVSAAATQVSDVVQQQAAALEETSAMLNEISSAARDMATNAQQAHHLAAGGASGNESVAAAMINIRDASRSVESITDVITDLAFQTNLLALNAAVEAARAGKQGLGFAVVASEVRNLAHKSASAAKEISSLIADAVSKVETGVKSVDALTNAIARISAGAESQADSVSQVSTAISQVDGAMQSNAAQAEELSATAERVASQADELRRLAAAFDFGDEASSAPAPAPRKVSTPPSARSGRRNVKSRN